MPDPPSESPLATRHGNITALTGLRFAAALLVAVSHFPEVIPIAGLHEGLERQGAAGVTIFFVLSGFVLTYTYVDRPGPRDTVGFYRNRIARVVPAYLLALALITPLVIATADPDPTARSWLVNAAMLQSLVPSKEMHLWNIPGWSVSTELVFYAAFPLIALWGLARIRSRRTMMSLAVMVLAAEIAAFAAIATIVDRRLRASGHDSESITQVLERVKFFPGLRMFEFTLGCLVGLAFVRLGPAMSGPLRLAANRRGRNVLVGLFVGGMLAILLIPTSTSPTGLTHYYATAGLYVLYTPLAVILVAALAWGSSAASPILEHRVTQELGEASYSFYILQWMFVLIVTQTSLAMEPRRWWYSTLTIVVLVVVSLASARWVERPANAWIRTRQVPASPAVP